MTDNTHPPDDEQLIAELRRVAGLADPVPERVLHAARGSQTGPAVPRRRLTAGLVA